jgi:hypothetical protein
MLKIMFLALALAGALAAEEGEFKPEDALYAPEDVTGSAEDAASPAPQGGSFYSSAKIVVSDFSRPATLLEGAELFIDGQYLGKSPLQLSGLLISKPTVALSARLPGYDEALRPAVQFPAEGEVRISALGDNAVSWYTTQSWVVGLLMIGGAIAAYSQNSQEGSQAGIALVGGGVAVIGISQAVARIFHLPALRRDLEALNAKPAPRP